MIFLRDGTPFSYQLSNVFQRASVRIWAGRPLHQRVGDGSCFRASQLQAGCRILKRAGKHSFHHLILPGIEADLACYHGIRRL